MSPAHAWARLVADWLTVTAAGHPLGWFFSVSGRWYAVTSGIGLQWSLAWWRHRNCHQRWCWRLGHHPDPAEPSFKRCTKHHLESKGLPHV